MTGQAAVLSFVVAGVIAASATEPPRIATSQYNNSRTGANTSESILTPKNVNSAHFGKVWSLPVDGDVYAQPLYLPHVSIPGKGIHNVLYVATEHDSVYAFDADSSSATPLWQVQLLPKGGTFAATVPAEAVQCPFIEPEVGITSTPVIDTETGTLYVLTRAMGGASRRDLRCLQQLHALAITTGVEKFGGPVEIGASVSGTGAGSSGDVVKFDALRENPRGALLLVNGSVYLTWASSCDVAPYHGWVIAYDARALRQQAVFNTSPDSAESGIWLSDTGPAADAAGNVYVVTGNGAFDARGRSGGHDYGDTALKLRLEGTQLAVADSFTPFNQAELNSTDGDLGSGGPVLLPGRGGKDAAGLVFGGKAGVGYAISPQHMGGVQTGSDASATKIRIGTGIFGAPAYWNGHLYYYGSEDALKDFAVQDGGVATVPSHHSAATSPFSGAPPTVSANGSRDGVLWLVESRAWNRGGTRAILKAFAASDVGQQLYTSDQNSSRDRAGQAVRFVIPTVVNGRVYFGVKKAVEVYGLLTVRQ